MNGNQLCHGLSVKPIEKIESLYALIFCILFQFLFLLSLVQTLNGGLSTKHRKIQHKSDADESIQSFVFNRAKAFGYGLRIIPRVKEFIFGRSLKSKSSKPSPSKYLSGKRKLIDFRRPSRLTAHVKSYPR